MASTRVARRVSNHRVVVLNTSHISNHNVFVRDPNRVITNHKVVVLSPSHISNHTVQVGAVSHISRHTVRVDLPRRISYHEVGISRNALKSPFIRLRPTNIIDLNAPPSRIDCFEVHHDDVSNFQVLSSRVPFGWSLLTTVIPNEGLPRDFDNNDLFSIEPPINGAPRPLPFGRHILYVKYQYVDTDTNLVRTGSVSVPIYVVGADVYRKDYIFERQAVRSESEGSIFRKPVTLIISLCDPTLPPNYEAFTFLSNNLEPLQVLDVMPVESFTTQRNFTEGTSQYVSWDISLNNRFPSEEIFKRELLGVETESDVPTHFYFFQIIDDESGNALCYGVVQTTGENTRFTLKEPKLRYFRRTVAGDTEALQAFQGGATFTVASVPSLLRGVQMLDQRRGRLTYSNNPANGALQSNGQGFLDYIFNAFAVTDGATPFRVVRHFFELCPMFATYLNESSLYARFGFLSADGNETLFAGLDQFGAVVYENTTFGVKQKRIDRVEMAINLIPFVYSRHYGDPSIETPQGIGRRSFNVDRTRGLRDNDGRFTGNSENGKEFDYWWGLLETANDLKSWFEKVLRMICDFELVQNPNGSFSVRSLWHSLYHDGKFYRYSKTDADETEVDSGQTGTVTLGNVVTTTNTRYQFGFVKGQRVKIGAFTRRLQFASGTQLIPSGQITSSFTPLVNQPISVYIGYSRSLVETRVIELLKSELSNLNNKYGTGGHVINRADVGIKPEQRKAVRVTSKEQSGAGNLPATVEGRVEFRDKFNSLIRLETAELNEVRASYQSRREEIDVEIPIASRRRETKLLYNYQPNGDMDSYAPRNRLLVETLNGYLYPVAFFAKTNDGVAFFNYYAEAYQQHIVEMNVAQEKETVSEPVVISLSERETVNSTSIFRTDLLSIDGSEKKNFIFLEGVIDRVRGMIQGNMIRVPSSFSEPEPEFETDFVVQVNFFSNQIIRVRDLLTDGFVLSRFESGFPLVPTPADMPKIKVNSGSVIANRSVPRFNTFQNKVWGSVFYRENGKRVYARGTRENQTFCGVPIANGQEIKNILIDPNAPFIFNDYFSSAYFRDLKERRWTVELVNEDGEKFYGFIDFAKGIYHARRRSFIGVDVPLYALFSSNMVRRLMARFQATRSFVLARFRRNEPSTRSMFVAIEPDRVIVQTGTTATSDDITYSFSYPNGFSLNRFYDINVVFRSGSAPVVMINGVALNWRIIPSSSFNIPDTLERGDRICQTYDDSTLLYVDYFRIVDEDLSGTVKTLLYDLSFPDIHGDVREGGSVFPPPNDPNFPDDLMHRPISVAKYYPSEAILQAENRAAGLSDGARGNLGAEGKGYKYLTTNGNFNATPIKDPFNDIAVINRDFLEI